MTVNNEATNAAMSLLLSIQSLTRDQIDRLDQDYIDQCQHPSAQDMHALFQSLDPSVNYLSLMSDFTHALINVSSEDYDERVEHFCAALYRALVRFEISQR